MLSESLRAFVQAHVDDDLARLALSAGRYPEIPVGEAIVQIEALRKLRFKIPSWYRFDLAPPPPRSVEQASSERTARFKAALFRGGRMADLTGGMGVDAYFFSQHFETLLFLERDPELVATARHNFDVLGAANINARTGEAEHFLQQNTEHFDLIYLDPARRDGQGGRLSRLADCQPNVLEIKEKLLAAADRVLLKTAPLLDLSAAIVQLENVAHIWVVSLENEVKEVLYLLEKTAPPSAGILIEAVCLGAGEQRFAFTRGAEQAAEAHYDAPGRFLYEPDAAVLKAGAFKLFGERFGLAKLHPSTQLYTSETYVPDAPGRAFAVEAVVKYDRKALRAVLPEGKAHVTVRNFPDSAEAARKKLGLADGGEAYVFGARTGAGLRLVVCRKIREHN